uniref:Uncharacterized protein n=1 Tax=Physcomitrium patens TaxID=3218 RepID=A0A2K1JT23_PHYPA|nr:hypothetical protein PHYPA_014449 [Physcomitrium patens]
MDEYLVSMKEAADEMEERDVGLPKPEVVYYTRKNLPRDYKIIKQMILNKKKLPTFLELEARLLNEENTRKVRADSENKGEALLTSRNNFRRPPHNQGGRFHHNNKTSYGQNGGYGNQRGFSSFTTGGQYPSSSYSNRGSLSLSSGGSYIRSVRQYPTHCTNYRNERHNIDRKTFETRSKLDSLEGELRSIIDKVRDLESKLHKEDRERRRKDPGSGQIHSLEIDFANSDLIDSGTGDDSQGEEDTTVSHVIDAYLAEINHVQTHTSPSSIPWYLNSGTSNHISGDAAIF